MLLPLHLNLYAFPGVPGARGEQSRPRRYILPDGRRVEAPELNEVLNEFLRARAAALEAAKRRVPAPTPAELEEVVGLELALGLEVAPTRRAERRSYAPSQELAVLLELVLPDDRSAQELIALQYFIRRRDDDEAMVVLLLM